jgi:hypothetical protein
MSNAEAKALGLQSGSTTGIDGWVGFSNTTSYTFDPNNRSVAGEVDFAGLADHEISEVMGKYGFGQNGSSGDSPIDLFRYAAPAVRDLAPACSGTPNYFSVNGGATVVNTFNTSCPDDRSDWAGVTPDAYNATIPAGHELPLTAGDLEVMDVLGYDSATAVTAPEGSTLERLSLRFAMRPSSPSFLTDAIRSESSEFNSEEYLMGSLSFGKTASSSNSRRRESGSRVTSTPSSTSTNETCERRLLFERPRFLDRNRKLRSTRTRRRTLRWQSERAQFAGCEKDG